MADWLWPLLGGLMIAAAAGPLGSLLLWRRMAYFGDSLAHASLLGVALALMTDLPMGGAVMAICLLVALLLSKLLDQPEHGADTWLAITAYAGLSMALVLTAAHSDDGHGHALEDYLFGNLLSIRVEQLIAMSIGLGLILLLLWRTWAGMVAMAINEDTARVDGWPTRTLRTLLLLLLAGVVAAGAKVMGVLLISALLVVPAAAARYISRSPADMAIRASFIGMLAVGSGVTIGVSQHLPIAPLVVLSAMLALFLLLLRRRLLG